MIWIVGSSLIQNASQHVRRLQVGQHLDLQRYGFSVLWAGNGSLILDQVMGLTRNLVQMEYAPSYFVLHIGGNDVGRLSCLDLCNQLNQTEMQRLMPHTNIVW